MDIIWPENACKEVSIKKISLSDPVICAHTASECGQRYTTAQPGATVTSAPVWLDTQGGVMWLHGRLLCISRVDNVPDRVQEDFTTNAGTFATENDQLICL